MKPKSTGEEILITKPCQILIFFLAGRKSLEMTKEEKEKIIENAVECVYGYIKEIALEFYDVEDRNMLYEKLREKLTFREPV